MDTSLSDNIAAGLRDAIAALLQSNVGIIAMVIALVILRAFCRGRQAKGWLGEKITSLCVLNKLDRTTYRVFNDLYLPRPDGRGTTQIDHVVVSPFGIFVIETKNMKGWIFGDVHSRQWSQIIFKKTYRFQNPLHQNFLHVSALAQTLDLPKQHFHNVVFFIGDATLKTDLPENVMTGGLLKFIRSHRQQMFTPDSVRQIEARIETIQASEKPAANRSKHRAQFASR